MHSAAVESSPRLQRVLALLQEGGEYSTRDIMLLAEVCAVNSCIAELRDNGYVIDCRQQIRGRGDRVWLYRLGGGQQELFKSGAARPDPPATPVGRVGPAPDQAEGS